MSAVRFLLIALVVALMGCGGPVLDQPIKYSSFPLYFTSAGVGRPFEEVGPVEASIVGPCRTIEGLENAALNSLVEQAKRLDADALLFPNSISMSGVHDPEAECFRSFTCGPIPLSPKKGGAELTGLAIKYQKPKTQSAPKSLDSPKDTTPEVEDGAPPKPPKKPSAEDLGESSTDGGAEEGSEKQPDG